MALLAVLLLLNPISLLFLGFLYSWLMGVVVLFAIYNTVTEFVQEYFKTSKFSFSTNSDAKSMNSGKSLPKLDQYKTLNVFYTPTIPSRSLTHYERLDSTVSASRLSKIPSETTDSTTIEADVSSFESMGVNSNARKILLFLPVTIYFTTRLWTLVSLKLCVKIIEIGVPMMKRLALRLGLILVDFVRIVRVLYLFLYSLIFKHIIQFAIDQITSLLETVVENAILMFFSIRQFLKRNWPEIKYYMAVARKKGHEFGVKLIHNSVKLYEYTTLLIKQIRKHPMYLKLKRFMRKLNLVVLLILDYCKKIEKQYRGVLILVFKVFEMMVVLFLNAFNPFVYVRLARSACQVGLVYIQNVFQIFWDQFGPMVVSIASQVGRYGYEFASALLVESKIIATALLRISYSMSIVMRQYLFSAIQLAIAVNKYCYDASVVLVAAISVYARWTVEQSIAMGQEMYSSSKDLYTSFVQA